MAKKSVDESPMSKQFRELKEKHPEALLLFRCGDFYETYEDDAKVAAKVLGITLTKSTTTGVRMAGFPHHALDTYLPKLVRYCNTPDAEVKHIAICDMLPDPPKPKRGTTETNNESNNQQTSEDKTMKTKETKNENKNVAMEAQVNNVKTDVDIAEVDDIVPVVTKKKVAEAMVQAANGGPATTMPLGKHGTLVIAGVGGKKSEGRGKTEDVPQTSAKVQDSVPATGKLTYQTYEKTKVNKTTGKPYTVTHAKIMGFAATDEAYQRGVELHGAASGEMVDGVKVLGLYFSHRYAAAAKLVCDALNAGKPFAECVAIIDNATEENAKKREEWKQKIEERKQKREERKAAREANTDSTDKTDKPTAHAMDAKEQAMFDLFKKFMAGDATAMQQVGAMMAKQAA